MARSVSAGTRRSPSCRSIRSAARSYGVIPAASATTAGPRSHGRVHPFSVSMNSWRSDPTGRIAGPAPGKRVSPPLVRLWGPAQELFGAAATRTTVKRSSRCSSCERRRHEARLGGLAELAVFLDLDPDGEDIAAAAFDRLGF